MKQFTAETFLNYQYPSNPRFSPDGKLVAFVLRHPDLEKNKYPGDVWILNNKTKQTHRLTALGDATDFVFMPDGKILFTAQRGEEAEKAKKDGALCTAYYAIDPCGGEATLLCTLPLQVGLPDILSDGRWLVKSKVDLNRPDFESMDKDTRKEALEKYENPPCRVFEEIPYWNNGEGDASRRRSSLYLCDPNTSKVEKVTSDYLQVQAVTSEFGQVVYTGTEYTYAMDLKGGLYHLDQATGKSRQLIEPGKYHMGPPWIMDKDTVIITLRGNEEHCYAHGDIYLVNIKNSKLTKIKDYDRYVGNHCVNSDARLGSGITAKAENGKLYFITTEDDESYLRCIDKKGNVSERHTREGSTDSFDIKDGKVVLCALRDNLLPEIYLLGDNANETRVTHFNDWVGEEYAVSTPENIRFADGDGIEIHGWVMPPVDYEKGKKYPAILHIHGGPRTIFGSVFHNEMQFWASQGYFVLFCNPRGSDGRGKEFADLLKRYGDIDYQNLMQFTDTCLMQYPDIDAKRMAVTGGSYGGFMTNWIIGHTERFKVACAQRSISSWISFEGTTDIGTRFNPSQHGALYEEDTELLWNLSPLKYADKAKTPTLFIHSEEDYRCYMVEALAMFTAIRMNGVESRIALFKDENHELSRSGKPQSRIRRMEEIINWINKYLKPEKGVI